MPATTRTRLITNLAVKSLLFSDSMTVVDFDTAAPVGGCWWLSAYGDAGRGRRSTRRGASVVAMSPRSHARPARHRAWRVATPVVVLLSGVLFAVSAKQSDGLDLRGGRLTDLASVVRAERDEAADLTAQAAELNAEVEALSARLGDRSVARAQDEVATLVDPAGLTEKTGPAVQVTLDDASAGGAPGLRGRSQRPRRAPAGHPGGGQRDVERRRRGGHHPGPAADLDHRHQVRGQPGDPARHPLLPALRHRRHRRPGAAWSPSSPPTPSWRPTATTRPSPAAASRGT